MQQPSAQGIASLYRGNPQPLQQSIQKEQQAKPGLPPDLQKMLALQIVTNEKNSVTAQKAMDQLQQMGGQGGKPPTVMASLQQQAQQKMQAQAQQARQQAEQRGLPAGLMGVQGEPAQPEPQPEAKGIDQLPVEFAGAEGGIVAFQNRGSIPDSEPASDSMGGFSPDPVREALNALRIDEKYAEENRLKKLEELRKKAQFLTKAGAKQAPEARAQLEMEERKLLESRGENAQPSQAGAVYRPEDATRRANYESAPPPPMQKAAPVVKQERPSSIDDISALAKQMQSSQAPTAPAAESDAVRIQKEVMSLNPEAEEAKAIAKRKAALPPEDLSQHDRLIAELEKRKKSLEPKRGFEGLMEYLEQVSANSQPGKGSFASGAAGARALNALNRERQTQQFELSKQAIEVSQKKLDSVRKYAEENYNIGKSRFDEVFKSRFAAAKEIAGSEAEAAKLAKQETLKYFELAQNRMLDREKMRSSERNAAAGRQSESQFISDWLAKPENKGKSFSDAYAAFKMAGTPSAGSRGMMTRDQASDNVEKSLENIQTARTTIADAKAALAAVGISNPTMAQIKEHLIQEQIKGVSLTGGAPSSGKVPPPPPGFKVN